MESYEQIISEAEARLNELGSKKKWKVKYYDCHWGSIDVHFDNNLVDSFLPPTTANEIINSIKLRIQKEIDEEEKYVEDLSRKMNKEIKCDNLVKQRYGLS